RERDNMERPGTRVNEKRAKRERNQTASDLFLSRLEHRVAGQRQRNHFAGLGRFIDRQDDFDRAASLAAVDERSTPLLDRLDEIAELLGVGLMTDGGRIGRAAGRAFA